MPGPRARIVDAHLHVWGRPRPERPFPWTEAHPVEALWPVLDASGVEAAVQVTPSPEGYDNRYGLAAAQARPDRLCVFGRLDPAAPDPDGRLRAWMQTRGARGVRLTAFGEGAGDRVLAPEPFWAACEELAVPVAVFAPDHLLELVRVLERHPRLRLIVDHLGLGVYPGCADPFSGWHVLPELVPFASVRLKVSGLVEASREAFPFRDVHPRLAEAVERFGSARLMWGSNHPVVLQKCSYGEALEYLQACEFLTDADLENLLHRTLDA